MTKLHNFPGLLSEVEPRFENIWLCGGLVELDQRKLRGGIQMSPVEQWLLLGFEFHTKQRNSEVSSS